MTDSLSTTTDGLSPVTTTDEDLSPVEKARKYPGRHFTVERGIRVRADRTGKLTYAVVVTEGDRNVWRSVAGLPAARALRAKLTTTLHEGGTVTRPKPVTLAEHATRWLDTQAHVVSPSTLDSYRSHWRTHVEPKLGSRKLATIGLADVRSLIADMSEERTNPDGSVAKKAKAPATIRRVIQVLSLILADAVEQRLCLTNAVVALPKRDRKAIRARKGHAVFPELDSAQVRSLIASTPERYRLLVATALLTGLRQGELLGLRWCDVARDAQGEPLLQVRVQLDRKGKLSALKSDAGVREVPIPDSLAKALTAHRLSLPAKRSRDDAYVFSTERGTPFHWRNVARRALDPAVKAAGLPRLRWHDLRHLFASTMIAEGQSVTYVSRILGHASPTITLDTYSHLFGRQASAEQHRAAAEARLAGVAL